MTISSVLAIARAAGDDPLTTFRAAANLFAVESDPEIAAVVTSGVGERAQAEIIESIVERRHRDEERRMFDTERMIRLAGGQEAS